jgi:hypothetical protein
VGSAAVGATVTGCPAGPPGAPAAGRGGGPAAFAIDVQLVNRTADHQVVSVTASGVDRYGHRRTAERRLAILQPLSTTLVALVPAGGPLDDGPATGCRLVAVAAADRDATG